MNAITTPSTTASSLVETGKHMVSGGHLQFGKRIFALEVRGDSMDAPTGYREGEFVYIDPDVAATHGKDVLARLDTGLTLKRYKEDEEGPYLFQLNGNKIIRPTSEWHVCGVVVFSGQKR